MGWGIELRKTCLWMLTLLTEGEGTTCVFRRRRSGFRADGDHDSGEADQGSGLMAIAIPG